MKANEHNIDRDIYFPVRRESMRRIKAIDTSGLALYTALSFLADPYTRQCKGYTVLRIAAYAGMSVRTATPTLKRLRKAGLITIERGAHGINTYIINSVSTPEEAR